MTTDGFMGHFVLAEPRRKQVLAAEYIERKYAEGYRDIVVAAPTGIGKTGLGATACFWADDIGKIEGHASGGYYLVTQKLLQDQLERDFQNYVVRDSTIQCRSIKTAAEYKCELHGNCGLGLGRKHICKNYMDGTCTYQIMRNLWVDATLSLTNYPYLFTEHAAVKNLPPRRVLVLDEAHTIERQILRFVEVALNEEIIRRWTPLLKKVPEFEDIFDFVKFMQETYMPLLANRLEVWDPFDEKEQKEKSELENYYGRIGRGTALMKKDTENWVFWQEHNRRTGQEAIAKPIDAAPLARSTVLEMGHVRIYLSAYPGNKEVFCRSLGLDKESVAWLNLNSTFPVENRQVYLTLVGSMGRSSQSETLPKLLRFLAKILDCHPDTKGLIHVHSYDLGEAIFTALDAGPHSERLIFPRSAEEREAAFNSHRYAATPTILISPSMAEGFDFAYELARWSVIAKCPWPFLGDRQVAAKMDRDPEWYDMETIKTLIQATGRAVRADDDHAVCYVLDSDFIRLWDRCRHMFPRWWTDALVFPDALRENLETSRPMSTN
jgi:Rad3-related DNA helicase